MDDERILAASVGVPPPEYREILLADYDPDWPSWFARAEEQIRGALGDTVLQLHHVGSTSVPGLAAKPLIDINLVVADTTDEDEYVPKLEAAGYVLRIREPDWYEHRMLRGQDPPVNLHVFPPGCEEVERMLVFRDWLRSNEEDRELYARTKRALAEQKWKYVQNYADAKSEVVAEILARARVRGLSRVGLSAHATVLLVDDIGRVADYYREKLGFEVTRYEAKPNHYAYASRDDCHVHFACFKDAAPRPNSEAVPPDMFDVYVYVDDVEALHSELVERGAELLHGPTDQAYGLREIRVRDPQGYILAFGKLLP
jgi:GrpB-like predicted nucleotidyltransferase (UPF0157 family)/catechol 2,3-dioxygenase-like lactoylglutathione lyase family enzyme